MYTPEGGGGQAREGKGRQGRRGLCKGRDTRQGRGEKGVDGGNSGRSPNARSGSCHRGRSHRSVRRYGQRRRGMCAASRRRGTRRWRTWSASAVATSHGAGTGHHLPVGDGAGEGRVGAPGAAAGVGRGAQRAAQWWDAEKGRAGRTERRSGRGAPRPAGGRAREGEPATGRRQAARCRARVRDK